MSLVLDATDVTDETELATECQTDPEPDSVPKSESGENVTVAVAGPGPVRSITLDTPTECETAIVLKIQQGSDGRYRSGFHVARTYETSPHERMADELPVIGDDDAGFDSIGEAVADAVDQANEWLLFHSDDDDTKADAAEKFLESWVDELDQASVTEAIFDDAQLPSSSVAIEPVYEDRCPACNSAPVAPTVTASEEAQKHFDNEKHRIEERLGELAIEAVRLKVAVKRNREEMGEATEELETLLARGPVRLPLFDQTKPAEQEAAMEQTAREPVEPSEPVISESSEPATADATEGNEPWRSVAIEEVGIDAKLCSILREDNNIATLGQISDWCDSNVLTDLKKIGEAKAAKIEEAMDAYWEQHPLTAED